MPTGGGKSLCIFLAPLAIGICAICIVDKSDGSAGEFLFDRICVCFMKEMYIGKTAC